MLAAPPPDRGVRGCLAMALLNEDNFQLVNGKFAQDFQRLSNILIYKLLQKKIVVYLVVLAYVASIKDFHQ